MCRQARSRWVVRRPVGSRVLSLLGAIVACVWQVGGPAPDFAHAAPTPPTILVDQPVFDFGKVPEGGVIRHVFKVKNTGGTPLEIKSVSAACGCTAAAPREKQIAPGRTGEIEVKFDTRNRPGRNEKTVTVVSSDPKTPSLTLLIRAEVEQMLFFDQAWSRVGTGSDEAETAEVWLDGKLAGRAKLRIKKLEPPGGGTGLSFQTENNYVRPVWPASVGDQQMMMHLDIEVDDLEEAGAHAVAAGAVLADYQPQEHVRVYFDPAGHPFCLWVRG